MSVQVYSLLAQTEGERKAFFGRCKKGDHIVRLYQEHLVVIRDEKVSPFVKFEIILPTPPPSPVCFLLGPLANKYCRTWSSMIKLWIDSRTCQKCSILLSARQKSNNYLELSKENVLRNMMLLHWPCFTLKFFMILFHKIFKLVFQKQPSCPRNICAEHWRKLPNLTTFLEIVLYLKNKDSVEHV